MPNLQFGRGCNIFTGIPETTCRFYGKAIGDKGYEEDDPSEYGVPFFEVL